MTAGVCVVATEISLASLDPLKGIHTWKSRVAAPKGHGSGLVRNRIPGRYSVLIVAQQQLKTALESLSSTPDTVDVSRFELLNGGSLWTVTFPAASGDVVSLDLDAAGLFGTGLLATISEDNSGGGLGGSFYLYSNGGSAAGFPIDAEGVYLSAEDVVNNGTGRSEPLQWDATADDVRVAIEGLLSNYVSSGIIF